MRPLLHVALPLVLLRRGGQAFVVPGPCHVSSGSAGYLLRGYGIYSCRGDARPRSALQQHSASLRMMATKKPPPSSTTKNLGSYYRRPSAAIERGGGFFVPGLEGFRLRFVLAAVTLGLLSLDGFSRPGMTSSQIVSEALAGLAGVLLFVQALLDQQTERAVKMRREAIAAAPANKGGEDAGSTAQEGKVAFFDSAALGNDLEGKIGWAADILLQLTAACSIVVFSKGKVLARVGDTGGESHEASVVAAAFERAEATAAAQAEEQTARGQQGQGFPSAIVVKREVSNRDGGGGADEALMQLLPSACRQGVLCKVPGPPLEGGGEGVVVLLGSTLAGTGVFSGMERAWFQRVCAYLALEPAAAAVAAKARRR